MDTFVWMFIIAIGVCLFRDLIKRMSRKDECAHFSVEKHLKNYK